jgi:hypothetical protein
VGLGGEQVRKGEGLAVEGQQYKAGWEFGVSGFFSFHDWLWKNSYGEKN